MSELSKLPNIGVILEKQLCTIGVDTPEQLTRLGSQEAWLRIQAIDPSACLNRLCALEGAIQGVRWHHLAPAVRQELKAFYNAHKLPAG